MFANRVSTKKSADPSSARAATSTPISQPSSIALEPTLDAGQYLTSSSFNYPAFQPPHIGQELVSNHRIISHLMISRELLKTISISVLKIKQYSAQRPYSAEIMNRIDIEKRRVQLAVDTRLFSRFVLDSSFAPLTPATGWIAFTVAGLDLHRERLSDELVTLYINQHMLPLTFDRRMTNQELLMQFNLMAGYHQMQVSSDSNEQLQLSVRDSLWREWDGYVYISGQGYRYANEQPLQIAATSRHATVEQITSLDLKHDGIEKRINGVLKRLNQLHHDIGLTLEGHERYIEQHYAQGLQPEKPREQAREIKMQFLAQPLHALMTIRRHCSLPRRENVINLLAD